MIPQKKGDPLAFATDEFIKTGTTLDAIAGLRPAFSKDGTVTAANASGINHGAAAVLVISRELAHRLGLEPHVRIKSFATAGVDPKVMGAWARYRRRGDAWRRQDGRRAISI